MSILFTTGCPKCKVLKAKLEQKNVQFTTIEDKSIMKEMGIEMVPMFDKGDGVLMSFSEAVVWVNSLEV